MKLFVFDLDYTLWNAGDTWCDCTTPPYYWNDDQLFDQRGHWLRLYEDVYDILTELKAAGKLIAAASRTNAPDYAKQLLKLFEIDPYFDAREIYPGDKIRHLTEILRKTNTHPHETVFFDDEYRNISDIRSVGIESVFVDNGLHWDLVRRYL